MNVVFWQYQPSHHQAGALRRFAEIWPGEVHWACEYSLEQGWYSRSQMGWEAPCLGKVHLSLFNNCKSNTGLQERARGFIEQHQDAIHIVGSWWSVSFRKFFPEKVFRLNQIVLNALERYPHVRAGFLSEGVDLKFQKKIRIVKEYLLRRQMRRAKRRFECLLAFGEAGCRSFAHLGYPIERTFPYIYQCPDALIDNHRPINSTISLLYIGQLTPRKGVDTLLAALALLKQHDWKLTVIGNTSTKLQSLAESHGIASRVEWIGVVPANRILAHIEEADLTLVPSRFEGWGMVTSESIAAGTGVIATDSVASSELVRYSGAGSIVKSSDPRLLASAIEPALSNPEILVGWRKNAVAYAHRITPDIVGEYLYQVMDYVFARNFSGERPIAPWVEPKHCEPDACSDIRDQR